MSNDVETELAPEAQAWSQASDEATEPVVHHSWLNAWGTSAVILVCCVVIAGIAGIALWMAGSRASNAVVPVQAVPPSVQVPGERENVPASTISAVPDALAESQDTHFLALLKAQGLVAVNDAAMINAAHTVCVYHRNGDKDTEIVQDLLRGGTDTAAQAFALVNTAINVYCPQ